MSSRVPRIFYAGPGAVEDDLYRAILAAFAWYKAPPDVTFWKRIQAGHVIEWVARGLAAADVLMADIRGANPNVLYEMGVFNALKRPVVMFKEVGQTLPFDVSTQRAIDVPEPVSELRRSEVWQEQVRDAVDQAFARAQEAEQQAAASEGTQDTARLLERLAWTGRLRRLEALDVRFDTRVVDLNRGVGRIASFVEDADGMRVEIVLDAGGSLGLRLPDDRLRLVDADLPRPPEQ